MRRVVRVAAVVLAALLGSGPAAAVAHPLLIAASPQPGLVAETAPATISLSLTETAVARGSTIRVTGPSGARVATTPVKATDSDRTLSVRPTTKLTSAVYIVRWSALGADGHVVSGSFNFGVAGAKGAAPPGVEKLSGAGGGRGSESANADSLVKILGRWLGVLGASILFGGFVLVRLLKRRDVPDEEVEILRTAAPLIWLLVLMAALEGVLAGASSGSGSDLDFGLLTASATGVSELVRAALVGLFSVFLVGSLRFRRANDSLYLSGGLLVLVTYAISGHVLSFPSFWSLLDQGVHVVCAGLWLGGVIALALITARSSVRLTEAARAFAPVAGGALGVAIVTGVLAAVREVDRWYFLRWSDYGRIVIVKAVLVGLVALLGAWTFWRTRSGEANRRLVRIEAGAVVGVLILAATLSGLAQGRGQPLPAQKGSLFPGPAFATAVLAKANAPVGLAPARTGRNVVTVGAAPGKPAPTSVSVKLAHAGSKDIQATLTPHGGLTWSAPVSLDANGTWFAYVTADGKAAPPVQLQVGAPHADGAPNATVLAVADLSGPAAERCRAHIIGLEMALARINGAGGVDSGHKVVPLVLDSGGTAQGAAAAAAQGLKSKPIASAGTCGSGGVDAVNAIAKAGVPAIVGDPAVDPTSSNKVFRLAADPYAQGVAFGQLVRNRIQAAGAAGVHTVTAVIGHDVSGQRLLLGLKAGMQPNAAVKGAPVVDAPIPAVKVLAPGDLAKLDQKQLTKVVSRFGSTAVVLDGPGEAGADAKAIAALGVAKGRDIAPAPILASERVLSETYVLTAGVFGRIGAVQGVTEVSISTVDAELYQKAVPLLFRGEIASVDGLRGYVTGLALLDALRDGPSDILRHLRLPRVFSNALLAPWSPRESGAGSPNVLALQPQFLQPTLVPESTGGEAADTEYFPQGSWTITSQTPLGIVQGLEQPAVR